ncbi:unnamed protein product [Merluccius merluccius]
MFKGPQTWSCTVRSLLVGVGDPMALPETICRRWCTSTGWRTLASSQKRRGRVKEGGWSFSKETLSSVSAPAQSSSGGGRRLLKAATHQNLITGAALSVRPRLPPPAQPKIRLEPRQCCTLKYLTQTSRGLSTRCDSLNNINLQPQTRLWNISQPPVCISAAHNRRGVFLPQVIGPAAHRPALLIPPSHPALWNQSRAIHSAGTRQATALRDCLSLENEQRCRRRLGRNLKLYEAGRGAAAQAHGKSQGRWASILVSLCSVQGEPAFLFTLRSSNLKRNKGDVSFAGGKNDPSDKDVVDTALREAREELGVTVATEKVWGILKPLRETTGMMIAPVLANLGPIEDLSFKPNPEEVEEIFTLSLSHVCNPSNRRYTHFRTGDKYGYTLPVFHNGKHRVWGLTAVALDHTLALITTP